MKSPLRYPGSKAAFSPYFFSLTKKIHKSSEIMVEPFAGSAAISLYALENNICKNVILIERDPLIYCFWKSVFDYTEQLVQEINEIDITLNSWLTLNELRLVDKPDDKMIANLGFAGLFFNRTNFSGIIGATPIGGMEQNSDYKINCRFNKKEIIASIKIIAQYKDRIEVIFGDAVDNINRLALQNNDFFFFIDPPYYKQGAKLYRYSYTIADHLNLSTVLKNIKYPYFLTYDKHHVIEYLYEDQYIQQFQNRYSTKIPKMVNELLISNREFKND
jgi:DNA adenine methylase